MSSRRLSIFDKSQRSSNQWQIEPKHLSVEEQVGAGVDIVNISGMVVPFKVVMPFEWCCFEISFYIASSPAKAVVAKVYYTVFTGGVGYDCDFVVDSPGNFLRVGVAVEIRPHTCDRFVGVGVKFALAMPT